MEHKARIFLSHSSADKSIAEKISNDLELLDYKVWLDKWEIQIGSSIPSNISKGLESADFVVILLSKKSVVSQWVDREWTAKYWHEIEDNKIKILPVLLEDCKIPGLLKGRMYADFRESYAVGFYKLAQSLDIHKALLQLVPSMSFEYPDLSDFFLNSISIDILGYDLIGGLIRYSSLVEEALNNSTKVRILYTKPTRANLEMIKKRASFDLEPSLVKESTIKTVHVVRQLRKKYGALIEIRYLDFCPSFGIFSSTKTDGQKFLFVKIFPFMEPTGRYPILKLEKNKHEKWFDYFHEQFVKLWDFNNNGDATLE